MVERFNKVRVHFPFHVFPFNAYSLVHTPQVSYWVATRIVRETDLKRRCSLLKRFIILAEVPSSSSTSGVRRWNSNEINPSILEMRRVEQLQYADGSVGRPQLVPYTKTQADVGGTWLDHLTLGVLLLISTVG
jgi:hypothetical protein